MSYELSNKLVVGVASSALFDLTESDAVFKSEGESGYREYQAERLNTALEPGTAFPFIRRLLSLNDLRSKDEPLVEVIILSRNDPDTGLRVMHSIKHHKLDITRAIFMQGRSPYKFMGALEMSLFLSANPHDVREALGLGFAAGQVIGNSVSTSDGNDLRIAFDFDGVLADDSSELIMQQSGLEAFQENEVMNVAVPMRKGRLADFLRNVNRIQAVEDDLKRADSGYNRRLHVAIVTARNAPAHERVVRTIQSWGLRVNDAFFLGGIDKGAVLRVLKPHIFFDDQLRNLTSAADAIPSVHIPFGSLNDLTETSASGGRQAIVGAGTDSGERLDRLDETGPMSTS